VLSMVTAPMLDAEDKVPGQDVPEPRGGERCNPRGWTPVRPTLLSLLDAYVRPVTNPNANGRNQAAAARSSAIIATIFVWKNDAWLFVLSTLKPPRL
jgi:hypothetical protein